jgi:hypothetical protein
MLTEMRMSKSPPGRMAGGQGAKRFPRVEGCPALPDGAAASSKRISAKQVRPEPHRTA